MKLSEEQLNKVYERKDRLGDFLYDCAADILSHSWESIPYYVDALPDQDIIDLVDWWNKKQNEQKYTIKVFPNSFGYLTIDDSCSEVTISDLTESDDWQVKFTKPEIEQFKQRDDLAIDWDKAVIEPVKED